MRISDNGRRGNLVSRGGVGYSLRHNRVVVMSSGVALWTEGKGRFRHINFARVLRL